MDADLPFGYLDRNPLARQQRRPPETSFPLADQSRDSVMSEPNVRDDFDFDVFLAGAEAPPSPTPILPPRMNVNATPWALDTPLAHSLYGLPPSREQTRQRPHSNSRHDFTSMTGAPRPSPPSMGMESLQTPSSQATAATQQANQEVLYETISILQQRESIAKLAPPPSKSTGSATRKLVEGECPVCWEAFLNTQTILFCKTTCGHNFHKSCIVEWLTAPANRQESLKCPMCRGAWDEQELKELHHENGISPPRPNKRYRPDPGWAARHQQREHLRRMARQRVSERRNSIDRSRGPIFDGRPNFIAEQSPLTSPTSLTGHDYRFSPEMMPYHSPVGMTFSLAQNAPRMAHSSHSSQPMASSGAFIQTSHAPRAAAFGVPQFMPDNGNGPTNGLQPAQLMPFPYQFQPLHETAYGTQLSPAYPMYPAMTPQNYQPATTSSVIPQFGHMSQPNHLQGIPVAPIMQHGNMLFQQHPCPAMRQPSMPVQNHQQPQFGNHPMLQPLSPASQASMQLRQYHYSQSYMLFMNH